MIADPMSEHRVAMSQARRALLSKLQFYSLFLIKERETGSKSSQVNRKRETTKGRTFCCVINFWQYEKGKRDG